jgi:UDPglucose--hexose-1-phosphate uridylyltransferase
LIATPILPKIIEEELQASKKLFQEDKRCVFCKIIEKERKSARVIWENHYFTVFAPWASVHPFEFWVFPRRHQHCLLDLTQTEIENLAKTMRVCFGGLKALLNDPPYNFGFHQVTNEAHDYYHWHLEVYPRLSIWAGFEKSTGMFINVVSPEEASMHLREAVQSEEKRLLAIKS